MEPREDRPAHHQDGRDESVNERMDRNWNELLQELRVTQTGTQILTGFLLAVAFQPRFTELDRYQLAVYCVLVALAVLITVLALAPVGLHRRMFRRGRKPMLVQAGHTILTIALIGVAVLLSGTVLLIFDWTVGRAAGIAAGAVVAFTAVAVAVLPQLLGAGAAAQADPSVSEGPPARADKER